MQYCRKRFGWAALGC